MTPKKDIEDRFASAVKSALDASAAVDTPSEAATVPMQVRRPKRSRVWGIALLCLAFAAITVVVVAAVLHVRGSNVARLAAGITAMWPRGAYHQPNETSVVPQPTAADEPAAAAASNSTMTAAPETPTAAISASSAATPGAFATTPSGASNAAAASASPAAEGSAGAALAPTAETSSTPASTPSSINESQQPLATPSAPPRDTQDSRQMRRLAHRTKQISIAAQTDHRAMDAAIAPIHGSEGASAESYAKAQATLLGRASDSSPIGGAEREASASTPSRADPVSVSSALQDPDSIGESSVIAGYYSESRVPAAVAVAPKAEATVASASTPAVVLTRVVLVSSPDRSVYWALEDSGTIFRSTDRKSWQKLQSGVQSDLLAGQAPSSTVCWVVGRKGAILLTIDGTRWQRLQSPITGDLVGVSAVSADVADIVAADGSRLSTLDRGTNWLPTDF